MRVSVRYMNSGQAMKRKEEVRCLFRWSVVPCVVPRHVKPGILQQHMSRILMRPRAHKFRGQDGECMKKDANTLNPR